MLKFEPALCFSLQMPFTEAFQGKDCKKNPKFKSWDSHSAVILYLAVPSHQILDWLNQCKFVSVWIWICRVWLFVVIDITRCRETPCNWFIISYIHYSTLYTYLLYVWADLKSQISQPKLTICCSTSHCSQQEWIDLNHLFHSLWSYTHTIYRIGLNGQIWQTFRCLSCKTRSDSQLQQAEMIQHTEGPYRQTCVMSSSWD